MIISANYFVDLIKKNKKMSETLIPELLKRLVRESINSNAYTHFPVGDEIYATGWDGTVKDNTIKHRFVPYGNSCFEIGTEVNIRSANSKINSDYEKRRNDSSLLNKSEYTMVLITTAILDSTKKESKSDNYSKEKIFKKVLIYDAVDIVSWLDEHIEICIWFLKQYNKTLNDFDIDILDNQWKRIADCTQPSLNARIFKIGNESNSSKLIDYLQNSKANRIISISSKYYGRDFSFGFCVASLIDSSNQDIIDRSIIVNNQVSMNFINSFCVGKIILVNFNCVDERFTINLNNTYIFFDSLFGEDIKLEMFEQKSFVDEIVRLGFELSDAYKIAFNTDYNTLALRRLLSRNPAIKIPKWSKNGNKSELIPLLLMGEIDMDNDACVEIVRAICGDSLDDYTEKLNIWSEMLESPILKYENIYKICSRRECFDFIQVDIFSIKLKKLEMKLMEVFSETDNKYIKPNESLNFHDKYKWNRFLIENIINGFIILSEKNQRNQIHFDNFVLNVLTKLYGNLYLSLTIAPFFHSLAELSPESFLAYINKSLIYDKNVFLEFLKSSFKNVFLKTRFIHYIFAALEISLKIESLALNGLKLMLDIYYFVGDSFALDEIIKYLSPISTEAGLICIPLKEKIAFFLNYIKGKPVKDTKPIVTKLYSSIYSSITIGYVDTYRTYPTNKINVNSYEIYDMQAKTFQWIINNESSSTELIDDFKAEIGRMQITTNSEFEEHLKILSAKISSCDDEIKAVICDEILRTRENILKYKEWNKYRTYLVFFNQLLQTLQPNDEYIRLKSLLIYDDYPLKNPISVDEQKWYEKEIDLRKKEKEDCLFVLLGKYGDSILDRLIDDCGDNFGMIWSLIYKHSNNHIKDLDRLIQHNYSNAINAYLRYFNVNELTEVLKIYPESDIVVANLPYRKEVFKLIDGYKNEGEFWKNQVFRHFDYSDFEYLFDKYLKFAPYKLIDAYAYFMDMDYNHCIEILKTIINFYDKESNKSIFNNNDYALEKFIRRLDSKFYSDEISICEFKLLPLLKGGLNDYPLGLKNFFWNHPEELGNLLINLYKKRNNLVLNSIGQKIYLEAFFIFDDICFIPKEYITLKRDKIKEWVNGILNCDTSSVPGSKIILFNAIVNTLTGCPKNMTDNVWPIIEVADLLEYIDSKKEDIEFNTAETFSTGYNNRRGLRSITNGSPEKKLSDEFKMYQRFYQFSHPVTSKALGLISSTYNYESMNDKKNLLLGDKDY